MAKKGKKPSIKVDDHKFTASWSTEKSYTDQEIEWQLDVDDKWGHSKVQNLAKGTSSKTYSVDVTDWYPNTTKKLYKIRCRLRYSYKSNNKTHKSDWGDWSTIDITRPKALSSNAKVTSYNSSGDMMYDYKWATINSKYTSSKKEYSWRSYYIWQTILMDKGKTPTSSDWSRELQNQTISRLKNPDDTQGTITNASPKGKTRNSTQITIIERWEDINAGKVRWFRVVPAGPQGAAIDSKKNTNWKVTNHPLGKNDNEIGKEKEDVSDYSSDEKGTRFTIKIPEMTVYSGDKIRVNYAITAPYVSQSLDGDWVRSIVKLPNGFTGWTQEQEFTPTGRSDTYVFETDEYVGEDTFLFVRFDTVHDGRVNQGQVLMFDQFVGKLSQPTLVSFQPSASEDAQEITVTINNNARLAENGNRSIVAVYLQRGGGEADYSGTPIGIIPYSEGEVTRTFPVSYDPGEQVSVNIKAYVADYNRVTYDIENIKMESITEWDSATTAQLPQAPANFTVTPFTTDEDDFVAKAEWEWTWDDANQTEITWSDSRYAWESTTDPSRYSIVDTKAEYRYVTGLSAGNYYFRVRFIKDDGVTAIYGPWSDIVGPIKMSTAPSKPTMTLSVADPAVIAYDEEVTAYWGYNNKDGTAQVGAKFATASRNSEDDPWVYTEIPDMMAGTDTKKTFTPRQLGWVDGELYNLCVRVISSAGESSESWSNIVPIRVAPKPVISVTGIGGPNDSLRPVTIEDEEDTETIDLALTNLPLTFTVNGCREDGHVDVLIERSDDFEKESPDDYTGTAFAGEVIFSKTYDLLPDQSDDTIEVSIDYDQLAPGAHFDNLASYFLHVTIVDRYGQTDSLYKQATGVGEEAQEPYKFTTYWSRSAVIPEAAIEFDSDSDVVYITPTASETILVGYSISNATGDAVFVHPDNKNLIDFEMQDGDLVAISDDSMNVYIDDGDVIAETDSSPIQEGDHCQIWRLSADKPQLILDNGSFDTTYVDPYPTYGMFGGYRIVYVTGYGDYKTSDNANAWDDYPIFNNKFLVTINFDDNILEFPGDISLSHSWSKDVQITKYLGGSVEGDWNPGIQRTGTINGTIPVEQEAETLYLLRLLADYPGICHVRTPDGSNFYADIQVKDDREERWVNKKSKITLTYTRVDYDDYDAIPYSEWIEEE